MSEKISLGRLKSLLHYDPDNGIWTRVNSIRRVGTVTSFGYLRIGIDGRYYMAHRLIWFYMTGNWPPIEIDHSNLDKLDNRWENLRLSSRSGNNTHKFASKNNSSGQKGVSWNKKNERWKVSISSNGNRFHLGFFENFDEAVCAYRAAAEVHHGEFAGP